MIKLVLFVFLLGLSGTDIIDYSPKALQKALKNYNVHSMENLTPIRNVNQLNGKLFAIEGQNKLKYVYVGRVNSCRAGGCNAEIPVGEDIRSEYFDYFVLFTEEKTVLQVEVFNYQATHGYEITAKGWLKQFVGYTANKPLKVGNEIDAISGATISVYAICNDIETVTKVLSKSN